MHNFFKRVDGFFALKCVMYLNNSRWELDNINWQKEISEKTEIIFSSQIVIKTVVLEHDRYSVENKEEKERKRRRKMRKSPQINFDIMTPWDLQSLKCGITRKIKQPLVIYCRNIT